MTHTPEPCLSKLTAAEFTLLENAGWTHDDLALAMPQELADAVRKERLHAAAPNLLAALQRLMKACDLDETEGELGLALEQGFAAIAKAKGE